MLPINYTETNIFIVAPSRSEESTEYIIVSDNSTPDRSNPLDFNFLSKGAVQAIMDMVAAPTPSDPSAHYIDQNMPPTTVVECAQGILSPSSYDLLHEADSNGRTGLYWAIWNGHYLFVIKELLPRGNRIIPRYCWFFLKNFYQ